MEKQTIAMISTVNINYERWRRHFKNAQLQSLALEKTILCTPSLCVT